jgi:hypothetical protein
MAESTDREFVVVKALAQMEMTPEEVAEMMDITASELTVDHGLDDVQLAQAISWCKSEHYRNRAERTIHPIGTPEYDDHDELGLASDERAPNKTYPLKEVLSRLLRTAFPGR